MSDRLPWFRCNPSALLGAMAGLQPDESLIYFTILLRIYETGGPIADTARTLSRRTGVSQRKAGDAIESLALAGKISILSDERIDSSSTHPELLFQRESRADKSGAGKASAEARKQRSKIDRIAQGDERVVRFPDQKTLKNQRSESTPVQQMSNKRDREEDRLGLTPARKTPIDPALKPDEEDIRVACEMGVAERDLAREAQVFRDLCLENGSTSANWRASWRRFLSHYRPSPEGGRPALGRGSREPRLSAAAQRLTDLHDKLSEAAATGALHVPSDDPDADELLLLEGAGDEQLLIEGPGAEPAADGEPDGGAGCARGEDRGVAWAAGGGSRPSDALLRAVGSGGHDSRASSALRRRKAPDTAA
jgi:uncharacterized protein YdaU (DUF1376 family)